MSLFVLGVIINNKSRVSKNKINEEIKAENVRFINEKGEQIGVISLQEAQKAANDAGLDLVQIAAESKPPVCKLLDFKKFLFDQKKKKSLTKKKQKQVQIKEIKFRPNTDIGDYTIKLNHLIKFLEEGNKAKVTLRFRGQEMRNQNIGVDLMKKVQEDLKEYGAFLF